jgi:hypothetical protein
MLARFGFSIDVDAGVLYFDTAPKSWLSGHFLPHARHLVALTSMLWYRPV